MRLIILQFKKIPAMSQGLIVVTEITIFYYTTWVFLWPENDDDIGELGGGEEDGSK